MGRFCMGRRSAKGLGLALMAAGLVILLLSVPGWMWSTLLGILLISVGFLVWRFG